MERCATSAAGADVPVIRTPTADLCPIVKLLDFLYKIVWSSPFRCLLYDTLNSDDNEPSTPRAEAAAGDSDGEHSTAAFMAAALGVEASETEGSDNAADGDQASVDIAAAALEAESLPAGNAAAAAEFDQIRGVAFEVIPLADVDDAPSEDDDAVDVGLIEEYSSFELI